METLIVVNESDSLSCSDSHVRCYPMCGNASFADMFVCQGGTKHLSARRKTCPRSLKLSDHINQINTLQKSCCLLIYF